MLVLLAPPVAGKCQAHPCYPPFFKNSHGQLLDDIQKMDYP
jgi:hypothetical protein